MKLFVWDFHGVLEKDNEKATLDISNSVLEQAGYAERFTVEDNERLYGLKWFQYFEWLLPVLPAEEHHNLQAACFAYAEADMSTVSKYVKPNDYARNVLAKIKESEHAQVVISNSRPKDIIWFLDTVGLKSFFDDEHIIGVNAHEQHGNKTDALKHFLEGKQFEKIIVIGDSAGDMELGHAIGAKTYFYKHPYRRHEDTTQADRLIKDLREVLSEL